MDFLLFVLESSFFAFNTLRGYAMNYAIVLAAGKGSRMHRKEPKGMIPILGKPMISYIIDTIFKTCLQHTICVLGKNKEQFQLPSWVEIAVQEQPLGTADAVRAALEKMEDKKGYTLIIPGDTPFLTEGTINALLQEHEKSKNLLTIGTIRLSSPYGYGRVVHEKEGTLRIVEEKDATKEERLIEEVYSGVMCINTQVLFDVISKIQNQNAQKEYYITDSVSLVSKMGAVGCYTIEDVFEAKGFNELKELTKAQKEYQSRIFNRLMEKGIFLENPDTITIGPDVVFLGPATIHQGTILLGKTTVYEGAILGPYSEIVDSTIYENVQVRHSVITNSIVQNNTTIGPFAHLRNQASIGENNRIGNFVEIKNSTTGNKTYASHLSYIGDTRCGAGVNFGCGTITVNYDGKQKHSTKIGNNVFIGCNSNLIAPIEIGSNSYIAAGSTIVESIEEGNFTIARAPQTTKSGYAKKYGYGRVKD